MKGKSKEKWKEPSHGLKSQQQRQAKRQAAADGYRRLWEKVKAGEGGPEKIFNAAARAGETKGLWLRTFQRKCANPELIGKEWDCLNALPAECESELVDFCVHMNRGGNPLNKEMVSEVVVNALRVLDEQTVKSGRNYKPLNSNARTILSQGSVSQTFFNRFHSKYEHRLRRKHAQEVDMKRALWCTQEVSTAHFKKLLHMLERDGITDASGFWLGDKKLNIFFCDECPGPIDGGSLKGAGTHFYAGAADPAYNIKKKCRELVTYDACFNFSTGEQVASHLIYACKTQPDDIFPDANKVNNVLVSNTESGFQNTTTWHSQLKHIRATAIKMRCKHIAIVVTDNGPGREAEEVLEWLDDLDSQKKDQMEYLSPLFPSMTDDEVLGLDLDFNLVLHQYTLQPNTTAIHAMPDQVFKDFHRCYHKVLKQWCEDKKNKTKPLNRAVFCKLWTQIYDQWVSKQTVWRVWAGARRVGFDSDQLKPHLVDQTKFTLAKAIRGRTEFCGETPKHIIKRKFSDLLTPDERTLITGEKSIFKRTKSDVEMENQRLRECLNNIASQETGLKALGFWNDPNTELEEDDDNGRRVTIKSYWGDTLNCGIKEKRAEDKEKARLAAEKSEEYHKKVAANKEAAQCKLELQAMASEDVSIDVPGAPVRYGPGYKKLSKRAACLKLLRQ